MSWDSRARMFALGVVLQPTPGVFVQPGVNDLIGISSPSNTRDPITAPDPTQTGTIWDAPPIFMGVTGTGGGTIPLRGPGGAAPPLANAWPLGIIMQACGFAEIRRAVPSVAANLANGSSTTALMLANTESAVDDALIGQPIQHDAIGVGFRKTTLIRDYVGATKQAILAETIVAPAQGTPYIFPASLVYLLGTMNVAPPLFSVSVWRDKKRYDYVDCVITSWALDTPVGNEQNTVFPSLDFAMRGTPLQSVDDVTPQLPDAVLAVQPPAAKGGKFYLDNRKLGHTGARVNIGLEAGAPSNQNQDNGQDQRVILSGTRSLDLTLNQSDNTTFDADARAWARTEMPYLSTWGNGSGNNIGLMLPGVVIDPLNPGETNGFVTVGGSAFPTKMDKGMALAFWWNP